MADTDRTDALECAGRRDAAGARRVAAAREASVGIVSMETLRWFLATEASPPLCFYLLNQTGVSSC